MAYEVLKDNYYRSSVGPLGLELGIRYDPINGNYELKEKNALGYDAISGNAIFYENGTFRGDALKDPRLFVGGDPTKMTPFAQQLSVDIKKKVYAAFLTKGGSSKGIVINNSARPANQNSPAGVNNSFPGTNPGIATAIPGVGGVQGLINALTTPGLPGIQNLNFSSKNEKDLFKNGGLLKYPSDILENQQDTLQITMYNYQAPLGDAFLKSNSSDIFAKGLQRNSALKERIGTVILPIPSGIQDNNAISWGDDSMNNFSAGIANYMIGKTSEAITGQTLAAAGAAALNVSPQMAITLATLAAAGVSPDNPLVKPSIISQLLKNAGVELPAETILARGAGIVPNSNLELLFQGPTLRSFGFTWRMSPRSEPEARNVKRIIRMFKQGSAPRKLNSQSGAGAASLFLGTPNVFKLSYKTAGNKEISGLNKFKICALVNMNVIYAPDGQWAAYAEGQPVSLTMTLNFQEIEPVYENDYQTDIFKGLENDSPKVYPDDVGY